MAAWGGRTGFLVRTGDLEKTTAGGCLVGGLAGSLAGGGNSS